MTAEEGVTMIRPDIASPPSHSISRRLPRPRPRTIGWLAMGAVVAAILSQQAGELATGAELLTRADAGWVAAILVLVTVRYAAAAVSVQAAVADRTRFGPTVLVQLASSFVGRFTPEGLGWFVLNQRYLERIGIPRASAIAAITLKLVAGGITRLAIAAGVLVGTGPVAIDRLGTVTIDLAFLAFVGAGVTALLALAWRLRRRLRPRLRPVIGAIRDVRLVLRQPRRAGLLFVTSGSLTVLSALTLMASAAAVGVTLDPLEVFLVYLGGTALAALSPTPGNLGALEVTLTAGLVAIGSGTADAFATVLLYRLGTFWLPIVPGFVAFRWLQTRAEL
jgi:undecaprenyl-diphosphatase